MSASRTFSIVFAWAAWTTGCAADVDGWSQPTPSPDGTFGVVASPRLGTVVDGPTTSASITFAGVHDRPGAPIAIQILADGAWVTIANTTAGTEPSSTDPGVYEWQVIASPAQLAPSRWPQGGLLRVRALGPGDTPLAGLFHDADSCLDENPTWVDRAFYCGDTFDGGIVVVSPADVAGSAARPRFLDRLGWIDPLETAQYYQTIGAPPTLTDFETKYGITTASTTMVYYNAVDLGIGREMRCQAQAGGGVACAVSNYGTFGGVQRDALDAAVDGKGAFATVTMVYTPPLTAPNSVQFMVYGPGGALANEAQLDSVGDNRAIPNNCINCHGTTARYDAATHQVTGASFLPFDAAGLIFSTRVGFTARDQAPALAQLNALVAPAASEANRELIGGWYPNGPTAAAEHYIPLGWTATPLERKVYDYVVAPTCRNCHASRNDALSFASSDLFLAARAKIVDSLCVKRDMPNAQVPLQHTWTGPQRAYLAAYLDIASCSP
jgi:hypothetical protein